MLKFHSVFWRRDQCGFRGMYLGEDALSLCPLSCVISCWDKKCQVLPPKKLSFPLLEVTVFATSAVPWRQSLFVASSGADGPHHCQSSARHSAGVQGQREKHGLSGADTQVASPSPGTGHLCRPGLPALQSQQCG